MKRIALMFLLAVLGFTSYSQAFDKVKNNLVLKKVEDAKTEADKIAADPKLKEKDKAEALFWQFAINALIYADSNLAAKYPGSDATAFQLLSQYEQKDTSLKALKTNDAIVPAIETIRIAGFNNGVKAFNTKNPQVAFSAFSVSLKADDFMAKHGFLAKNFVDTTIVLYAGYAAQNSGDLAGAVGMYTKLIDAGIKPDNKDYQSSIYAVVLNYYASHNDQPNFQKYAAIIKQQQPQYTSQIDNVAMQNMTSNTALPDLIAKYKQESAGNLSEQQLITYAEAFAQPDKDELAKLDSAKQVDLKLTAAEAYGKAYVLGAAKNNAADTDAVEQTALYAYNAGILYYTIYDDLDQRAYNLRGSDVKLKAKREEAEKQSMVYADSSAKWFNDAYNIFKAKGTLSKKDQRIMYNTTKNLSNIYQKKEDKARGYAPADVDKYEALYKQFDAEADKYSH